MDRAVSAGRCVATRRAEHNLNHLTEFGDHRFAERVRSHKVRELVSRRRAREVDQQCGLRAGLGPGTRSGVAHLLHRNIHRLAEREQHSFASILNTQSQRHGAYQIGETIPDAGVVESIGHDYLEFRGQDGIGLQRVVFGGGETQRQPASRVASSGASVSVSGVRSS